MLPAIIVPSYLWRITHLFPYHTRPFLLLLSYPSFNSDLIIYFALYFTFIILSIIIIVYSYLRGAVVSVPSYESTGMGLNRSLVSQCSAHPAVHSPFRACR